MTALIFLMAIAVVAGIIVATESDNPIQLQRPVWRRRALGF